VVIALATIAAHAQVVVQLTDHKSGEVHPIASLTDDGAFVYVSAASNQLGGNPSHASQIYRFDGATGAGTLITSFAAGATMPSVSDDGQWIAFVSNGDLTGGNADRNLEVFVMHPDGTGLAQVTNDPAVNSGSASRPALSGSANKIAFYSVSDYGNNPNHNLQLFVINRDGTGLLQLTPSSGVGYGTTPSISDDGSKITFTASGNLTGSNADLSFEAFAVLSNGTGLRQLTNNTSQVLLGIPGGAVVSGDGSTIAFDTDQDMLPPSNADRSSEVFVMNWDGTGLRQLSSTLPGPGSLHPAISDTGGTVFFLSHRNNVPGNTDGNAEVFKINKNGTGLTQLTTTTSGFKLHTTASGNGGRVAFMSYGAPLPWGSNPDLGPEIHAITGTGTGGRQLTDLTPANSEDEADITAAGNKIYFVSNESFGGLNPGRGFQVWRINSDKTGLQKLTNFDPAKQIHPRSVSVSGDGSKVTFAAQPNPKGVGAPDIYYQVWSMNGDGTALTMLTNGVGDTERVAIARNGSLIAFDTVQNVDGTESPTAGSDDVFVIKPDGTGLRRLTTSPAPPFGSFRASHSPRIDGTGTYVTFYSAVNLTGANADGSYEIFRIKSDGTNLQQLTSSPAGSESESPDISDDGRWVAFHSTGDLLGTNADRNYEMFIYDTTTATLRQFTSTTLGDNGGARLSDNGQWLFFGSRSPIFESDPDGAVQAYRARVSDGLIQRFSGLLIGGQLFYVSAPPGVSASGDQAALVIFGDPTLENPDLYEEIFIADAAALNAPNISRSTPTLFAFRPEPSPVRYDMIRGNVANLGPGSSGTVNLGLVSCLENDSPDATIAGHEDSLAPAAGQAFFYLYRGSQGLSAGPGSYGVSKLGLDRKPSSGDCSN
jgi:Tol biopolymer transport system component